MNIKTRRQVKRSNTAWALKPCREPSVCGVELICAHLCLIRKNGQASSEIFLFLFVKPTDVDSCESPGPILVRCEISGEHVGGQLEVFEGVEGDVSVVHHGKDHWDISALEGQQLDGSQVRHRAVETASTRTKDMCDYRALFLGWAAVSQPSSSSSSIRILLCGLHHIEMYIAVLRCCVTAVCKTTDHNRHTCTFCHCVSLDGLTEEAKWPLTCFSGCV